MSTSTHTGKDGQLGLDGQSEGDGDGGYDAYDGYDTYSVVSELFRKPMTQKG